MRAGWAWTGLAMLLGCGPVDKTGSAADGGTGSGGGSPTHVLTIHTGGSGSGAVRSSNPPIDCRGLCTQNVSANAQVVLVAVPDANSTFAGWQGACSGKDGCTIAMDSDRDVAAAFTGSAPPVGQARVSVTPVGKGSGRVTSSPAGIDCPASCLVTVPAGTAMTLTAKPDANSIFVGWGGACGGPGVCNLVAEGDLTAWANFEPNAPPPPPLSCDGLSPTVPGTAVSTTIAHFNSCESGIGDSAGTIGLRNRRGDTMSSTRQRNLYFLDEVTGRQKTFIGNVGSPGSDDAYFAQDSGFLDVMYGPEVVNVLRYDHDGRSAGRSIPMAAGKPAAKEGHAGKGLLLAGAFNARSDDLRSPIPQQICFFADGVQATWCHDLPQAPIFGLAMDANDRTLVIIPGATSGTIDGLWFDADGTPLTTQFRMISNFQPQENTWFEGSPLIGGDLAVRRLDQHPDNVGSVPFDYRTSQWLLIAKSGSTTVSAAPQWLLGRPNTNMGIVRSGKAYAMVPLGAPNADCSQKIEVLAADGTSCGSFDAGMGSGTCRTWDLTVTLDGTPVQILSKSDQAAYSCSWRWWPKALR